MEYFSPAVQLGLTATPKRKGNADTYSYFGEPVYIYSLKEGINDGFLTPFKVNQIATTLDDYVYTSDDQVVDGEVEQGKLYEEADFNKIIEIKEREAYRTKLFMEHIDQKQKTLVFCATQVHALAVRDLINQLKTSTEPNYCVRVTANDGALGEQFLRTFQDNEKTIPTILTTSQKLSTGVDARNIRNIVLMRPVNSMIEFKQIIGRGTRLFDGKDYFTVYDFVQAYKHFSDPEWDGEPMEPDPCPECGNHPCTCVKELCGDCGHFPCICPCANCGERPCICPCPECGERPCVCLKKPKKVKIKLADGKERVIQHMMATTFWNPDGTPMSAAQFIERLFGELPAMFRDEDELRALWGRPDTRKALLDGLAEKGYGQDQLTEIKAMIDAEKSDLFDVLAYIAFALAPISREERVATHRANIDAHYADKQQAFLDFVLGVYIKDGVRELDQDRLPLLIESKYGGLSDGIAELGSIPEIRDAFIGFQQYLYAEVGVA
jgi:type I restriction enzyme R subunit